MVHSQQALGMGCAGKRIRVRCEKGKPVVRRGRKAYGPPPRGLLRMGGSRLAEQRRRS
jgi:hypothetical protein